MASRRRPEVLAILRTGRPGVVRTWAVDACSTDARARPLGRMDLWDRWGTLTGEEPRERSDMSKSLIKGPKKSGEKTKRTLGLHWLTRGYL